MEEVLAPAPARRRFPVLNVALFLLTIATTVWAGYLLSAGPGERLTFSAIVSGGLPFAASLVGILFTHEMGHYVLARRHRVDTTLPYFIPIPMGFGTLGAVIRMRSAMPSRRATLDIGAAGPIAGFVVAVPLLFAGLAQSEVVTLPGGADAARVRSLLDLVAAFSADRPASGLDVLGDSLLMRLAVRMVHGELAAGTDVLLGPVALAAWLGLFVTALNLVPIGQLDGGHVTYAVLGGARAERLSRVVSLGLLAVGVFVSFNWFVWWLLTRLFVGVRHPPARLEEPLGKGRVAVAILSLAIFVATFVPVPIAF